MLVETERATAQIHDRVQEQRGYEMNDRFVVVKMSLFKAMQELSSIKLQLEVTMKGTADYKQLKLKKMSAKGTVKIHQQQYDKLKVDLEYESPSDSPVLSVEAVEEQVQVPANEDTAVDQDQEGEDHQQQEAEHNEADLFGPDEV